jgi:hypothetical protein
MELNRYPHTLYKGQDEEAVRVELCFRGQDDHNFYCVKLRIPKAKLKQMHGKHTAADEPDMEQ